MQIASAQTADGATSEFLYLGSRQNGKLNLYVTGSLGGGTLTLQAEAPDGSFVDVQTVTVGLTVFESAPVALRLSLTGSTGANFSAWSEDDSEYTQTQARGRD